MAEVGESPPKPKLPRRALFKAAAALGLTAFSSTATGSTISPDPEEFQAKETAKNLQEIIKPPTQEEIDNLKTKLTHEIDQPFTYDKQTFAKNGFIFDLITTNKSDNQTASSVMVRKDVQGKTVADLQDIVVYFHSIDGAASDVAGLRQDFNNIWNNNGAVIFPVTKSFKSALEVGNMNYKDDDFFKVEDQNNTTKYLAEEKGRFDENSPIDVLQSLHNLQEAFSELKGKTMEIAGISLGASTAIDTLTMWEEFAKKYSLPDLKKVSLYAPVNTLLDQKIMTQALQEGKEADRLGVHRIFRSLTRSVATGFQKYMQERFQIQKTLIANSNQRDVFLMDKGDPKRGIPPKTTKQKGNISDQDANLHVDELTKKYNLKTKDPNRGMKDLIGPSATIAENLTGMSQMKNDNPIGFEMLREKLMLFSPNVMLDVMKSMGGKLPDVPINIVYANFDSVVPPQQSKQLAHDLKERGSNVKTTEIFGGHIHNPHIMNMLSFLRKQ